MQCHSSKFKKSRICKNDMEWLLNLKTIFLSIIIEASPFILIGVIVSSIFQNFITDKWIQRLLPKNFFFAFFPAALLGILFPICECAIIPVVRGLIKRGLPLHLGTVILIASPIINPIVFISTYYAFGLSFHIAILRIIIGFFMAFIVSFSVYLIFKNTNQLKPSSEMEHKHEFQVSSSLTQKFINTMFHIQMKYNKMGKSL